jgi:hypothetical protein
LEVGLSDRETQHLHIELVGLLGFFHLLGALNRRGTRRFSASLVQDVSIIIYKVM